MSLRPVIRRKVETLPDLVSERPFSRRRRKSVCGRIQLADDEQNLPLAKRSRGAGRTASMWRRTGCAGQECLRCVKRKIKIDQGPNRRRAKPVSALVYDPLRVWASCRSFTGQARRCPLIEGSLSRSFRRQIGENTASVSRRIVCNEDVFAVYRQCDVAGSSPSAGT